MGDAAIRVAAYRMTGAVEYREIGEGSPVVFAPGSCSTGAAWRPVIAQLEGVRAITTSLSGYGGTDERRTATDRSMTPIAEALEDAIAGEPVHLVGHSFGGLAAIAVALRGKIPLLSLTVLEAPAVGMLTEADDTAHLAAFRRMTDAYADAHRAGVLDAIEAMIDFYGGIGCWAAMPEAVRGYAAGTAAVNLLDWEGAYGFAPGGALALLRSLRVTIAVGERSHPAVIRSNALIAAAIPGSGFERIAGAAHFMIATHAKVVAQLIARSIAGKAGDLVADGQRLPETAPGYPSAIADP